MDPKNFSDKMIRYGLRRSSTPEPRADSPQA